MAPTFFPLAAEQLAAKQPTLLRQLAMLLAILVVARIGAELAERVRVPGVLAEIAIGVLLGPSALGIVEPTETIHLLAEVGAILLLFEVGLHMDPEELLSVGPDAGRVAVLGVIAPGVAIALVASWLGVDGHAAVFLGGAATATSVGITARVFSDMKVLATVEARTVLGAAVVDDVLGLLVLTGVTQAIGVGNGGRSIGVTIGLAAAFLVVGGALAMGSARPVFEFIARHGRTEGAIAVGTIAFALAFASAGAWAGLAPLIGGFLAGVAAARSERSADLAKQIAPLGQIIIPIFFVSVGLQVDVAALADPGVLGVAGLLTVVAVGGKIVAGAGMFGKAGDRLLVGLGMIPRGEVGLIFATLGATTGVLDARDHAALILMVLLTTVLTPPLLRMRIARTAGRAHGSPLPEGEGGLRIERGTVTLTGAPPAEEALYLALRIARAASENRVDPPVIEWLRQDPIGEPAWDERSRHELFQLLRTGRDRSFRLLETTNVFATLFPAIANEARHAVDPFGLEGEATWERLLELQALLRDAADPGSFAYERLRDPHILLLVALCRGAFVGADAADKARQVASQIGLPWEQAEEIGELTAERHLLTAAALDPDLGDRQAIVELALHLGTIRTAASLYILAAAEHQRDRETRARLDALYELIEEELTGATHGEGIDLLEGARQAVMRLTEGLPHELVIEHLEQAPRRYLLTTPPESIARHLRMLDPVPEPDDVRVHLEPVTPDSTRVHLVFRDRRGALAALAQACTKLRLPIEDATASVWSNGIAITTFLLATPRESIDLEPLQAEIGRAIMIAEAIESLGRVDGHVAIDNHASPWYSIVELRAPDRVGLLAKFAAAISAIGGEIVSASITTHDGVARDRFLVEGPDGGKLDARDERALRQTLATGKRPTRLGVRR